MAPHGHAFSPDGRFLWISPLPELLDLTSGKAIPLYLPGDGGYPKSTVPSLVWTPSGDRCLYTYLHAGGQKRRYTLLLGVPGPPGLSVHVLMDRPAGNVHVWSADGRVWLGRWEDKERSRYRISVFRISRVEE